MSGCRRSGKNYRIKINPICNTDATSATFTVGTISLNGEPLTGVFVSTDPGATSGTLTVTLSPATAAGPNCTPVYVFGTHGSATLTTASFVVGYTIAGAYPGNGSTTGTIDLQNGCTATN